MGAGKSCDEDKLAYETRKFRIVCYLIISKYYDGNFNATGDSTIESWDYLDVSLGLHPFSEKRTKVEPVKWYEARCDWDTCQFSVSQDPSSRWNNVDVDFTEAYQLREYLWNV